MFMNAELVPVRLLLLKSSATSSMGWFYSIKMVA